jgi:hypothetical protein
LARATGLDAAHIAADTAFIDGLVADGIWAKLDALYIFATQNGTAALLNMVQNVYNATLINTPVFTADRGFTSATTGNHLLNTNFNPNTASSPKLVQNSAHISTWSVTNIGSDVQPQMGVSNGGASFIDIFPNSGGTFYTFVNSASSITAANANSAGHYIANRSASNALQGYKTGSSVATGSIASAAVAAFPIVIGGQNNSGGFLASNYQTAGASIGSSLDATQALNFYNRWRTRMTAVGVP